MQKKVLRLQEESVYRGMVVIEAIDNYLPGIRCLGNQAIEDIMRVRGLIQGDIIINEKYMKETKKGNAGR